MALAGIKPEDTQARADLDPYKWHPPIWLRLYAKMRHWEPSVRSGIGIGK